MVHHISLLSCLAFSTLRKSREVKLTALPDDTPLNKQIWGPPLFSNISPCDNIAIGWREPSPSWQCLNRIPPLPMWRSQPNKRGRSSNPIGRRIVDHWMGTIWQQLGTWKGRRTKTVGKEPRTWLWSSGTTSLQLSGSEATGWQRKEEKLSAQIGVATKAARGNSFPYKINYPLCNGMLQHPFYVIRSWYRIINTNFGKSSKKSTSSLVSWRAFWYN